MLSPQPSLGGHDMNGRCLRLQCEVDGSARKETIEPGGSSKHYMSAFGGKADIANRYPADQD